MLFSFLGWCGRIISYWKSFAAGSGLYRRRLSLRPFILKKEEKNVKPIRLFLLPAAAAAVMLSPLILKGTDEKFRFSGVENQAQFPEITAQKLSDGQAQTEFEAYVQQHLPGKPFMVRLRNEITFSLLDTVSNINYSMSKDKNLFSWENVSYYLQYFAPVSKEGAYELVEKLERLQKLLEDAGKQMYVFITPCKIRYTEDQLPWVDKAMAPPRKEGNYELLTEALSGSRIRYFDSIRYLEEHKSEFDSRVPLFYRTGLHWSVYVGNMTGAAFGEFLEQESGYNLPEMTITAAPCENPVYPDADSFEVFNTIGKPYDQYYEPVIEITDEETDAPGFLCRGGSFMGQSLSCLIQNHYFGKNVSMENRQIFTEEFGQVKEFSSYEEADMRECLRDIDLVVLEVNETAVSDMSFGFIDYVLEHPEILREE